jgi:hypothetical protein
MSFFRYATILFLLLRQLYIRKLPLTRYCRSNNCHAFRLPRKGREKRHFNHLINAALQSSVYGHFIAALINTSMIRRHLLPSGFSDGAICRKIPYGPGIMIIAWRKQSTFRLFSPQNDTFCGE